MSFQTASAILRGKWFIQKEWAHANMGLVIRMLKGESVDFGMKRDESLDAKVLSIRSRASYGSIYRVGYYTDLSKIPENSIAMVDIVGPVTKFGDMCSWGSVDHAETVRRLTKAQNISGIIINVDSPGGEAFGTSMLADTIKEASAVKPVIGIIDDGIAASAGYWIVSACTEVYVTKRTDMVGSVGVYCAIADWYGYFESEGLKVHDVYAPQSTDKNKIFQDAIEGNDKPLQAELKVLASEFIDTVKTNRGSRLTSDEWDTGKMFYTKDAIKIGLIDGQMTLSEIYVRMGQMIEAKQQQSSNKNTNMSYPKTQKAAKTEGFQALVPGVATEVESSGVFVSDDAMANIEAALTENENAASQLEQVNATLNQTQTDLNTANTTITSLQNEIKVLKGEDGTQGAEAGDTGKDNFPKTETAAMDFAFQKELLDKMN